MTTLRISDLMTRNLAVIRRDRDVHELERLLLEKKVHGVPVIDEDERLVGVVSQSDLVAWHYLNGIDGAAFYDYSNLLVRDSNDFKTLSLTDIQSATVEQVMSPVVHCIGPDRPVAEAAGRMIEERIHRLVVVDENRRVLGVVSAIDVLRAVPGVDPRLRVALDHVLPEAEPDLSQA